MRTALPVGIPTGASPAIAAGCCARGGLAALLAVVGPGVLAGLSDDDPAGITTYSILGARYGYELLWVLALSTAALIVFHELGVRLGVVTGKGLLTLVRERFGPRAAALVAGGPARRQHRHALRRVRRGRRRRGTAGRRQPLRQRAAGGNRRLRSSSCARTSTESSTCCSR